MSPRETHPGAMVARELERYAARGTFHGLRREAMGDGRAAFRVVWHHGREFQIVADPRRRRIRIPVVLPNVPPGSAMDRELRTFVRYRHSEVPPEHRRIDPVRAEVRVFNRGGNLALTLEVRDGGWEYGVRKLIHLVHEIFLDFLYDGRWREYMVAELDLPPDA